MVETSVGPGTCEVGCLSPPRIKGAEGLGKEKKVGLDFKPYVGSQSMRPEVKGKGIPCGERAEPFYPERGPTQGTRRKFKKMARDKGKVQESVGAEKA